MFVVVASLLAYFFAPKGENQTYVVAAIETFINSPFNSSPKSLPAQGRLPYSSPNSCRSIILGIDKSCPKRGLWEEMIYKSYIADFCALRSQNLAKHINPQFRKLLPDVGFVYSPILTLAFTQLPHPLKPTYPLALFPYSSPTLQ